VLGLDLLYRYLKMKQVFILIYFLSCSFMLSAQVITVQDSSSNAPLEFVTIATKSPHEMVSTNSNGKAVITVFKDAEEIQIRLLGYQTIVTSYDKLISDSLVVKMKSSEFSLNQVVISANRWKQNSLDIPQKISTIKPKEAALQNPQTAADLLEISGNVFIQKSQQGGGSPMIRGFSTNRLLYSIDGVRMNTAIFRGGNIQNVISLDPFAIENTEVLFGPGSVIYGSDAIGGVMSFQTLTPELSLTNKAVISGKAYFVKRINGVDQVITQDDPLLQVPSAYSQTNFMQKVRFKPNKNWDFQYGFHYSETSPYGRYDRHNRLQNGLPRYAEWNYGPQKWMMNHLSITNEGKNHFYDKVSLRLAQQSFEESRIERGFNESSRSNRTEEVQAYSVNLDFVNKLGSRHTLFYGGEYILNVVESTGVIENINSRIKSPGASRYPDSDWSSMALYVNDEFSLTEKVKLQAGLRYNQFILNSDFDTTFYDFSFQKAELNNGAITGSVGAVYRPIDQLVLSSNFGTAFRSPNVDDIGKVFDSEQGSVVVPNPDLNAEYAYNIDIGAAFIISKSVKIDLTGYYTLLENALVRRNFRLNGNDSIIYDGVLSQVQAIQNAAVANVFGVQAGLEIKLPKGFSFSANANFQQGKEEQDNGEVSPSRHAAPFFGSARLNFNNSRLNLQLNMQYQAERKFEDMPIGERSKTEIYALNNKGQAFAPAWYVINFKANYQISPLFGVSSGIENITDQRYRPYSSGISAPGRNFIIGLNAKF